MDTIISVDGTSYDLKSNLGWLTDFPEGFEAPKVRTNYKIIPGRNGELDLTEIDGNIYYEPIEFTIECQRICKTSDDIFTYASQLMGYFHGKEAMVFLDTADYYYQGRLSVGAITRDGLKLVVELVVRAFPFRLATLGTLVSETLSNETKVVTLTNGQMRVVPTITTTATMTLAWDTYTVTISQGSDIVIPDLVLEPGTNTISVTGTGTITFTYQKGIF